MPHSSQANQSQAQKEQQRPPPPSPQGEKASAVRGTQILGKLSPTEGAKTNAWSETVSFPIQLRYMWRLGSRRIVDVEDSIAEIGDFGKKIERAQA